jgi:LPS sulfotransferase NodH
MLMSSGVAGRPAEHIETLRPLGRATEPREYFAGVADEVLELLPASAPARPDAVPITERVAELLRHATTPNGVFGTKVMWSYFPELQERLAELPELASFDEAARLTRLLGDVRYVHVFRRDHVAQAISMWRAVQTRAWRADHHDAVQPRYSFTGIDHLVRMLDAHDGAWCEWFARHAIQPLRLSYDEVAADPAGTLRRTLEFLAVIADLDCEPPRDPPLRRQAGAQSVEWAERYLRERAARAP